MISKGCMCTPNKQKLRRHASHCAELWMDRLTMQYAALTLITRHEPLTVCDSVKPTCGGVWKVASGVEEIPEVLSSSLCNLETNSDTCSKISRLWISSWCALAWRWREIAKQLVTNSVYRLITYSQPLWSHPLPSLIIFVCMKNLLVDYILLLFIYSIILF